MEATPRQMKALIHPLRWRMMAMLDVATAGSPAALTRAIDDPKVKVNLVAYHMGILERAGLVELVGTEAKRGSVEHHYRAIYSAAVGYPVGDPVYRVKDGQLSVVQPARMTLIKRRRR